MEKQYKVIEVSDNWSLKKLRIKLENKLNEVSQQGWEVVSLSFVSHMYKVMITIRK